MATQPIEAIPAAESERRRTQITRAIRLNQNEGLDPTPRLLALADRYIAGELSLDEYTSTIRSW
jgi:hypothetical protein